MTFAAEIHLRNRINPLVGLTIITDVVKKLLHTMKRVLVVFWHVQNIYENLVGKLFYLKMPKKNKKIIKFSRFKISPQPTL